MAAATGVVPAISAAAVVAVSSVVVGSAAAVLVVVVKLVGDSNLARVRFGKKSP